MVMTSQKLNDRLWLAEEVSNDHLLNVNKVTKPDVSLGLSSDKNSNIAAAPF